MKSPTLTSPTTEAADIYRKQSARIEELENDKKNLEDEVSKLRNLEEELEDLRESNGETAALKDKASEADKLKEEVASLKRQNAQLTAAAKNSRRESTASPEADLKADLESKSATIEALELEISALNARLLSSQSSSSEQSMRITDLESDFEKATASAESATQELTELRENLAKETSSSTDAASLTRKIAQLEAELGSARRSVQDASGRTERLEKKIAALTTLHREAETRHTGKLADLAKHERELKELRARLNALRTENDRLRDDATRRKRLDAGTGDEEGLDELEDEERTKLQSRVRELESENFDLRRGVWRDQRRELQPGLEDSGIFDEVDLSPSASSLPNRAQQNQQHSSFTDVIQSGISAFTGANRDRAVSGGRKQSLGLLDEDEFEFDEEGFAKAQAEEAMARIERVKDVKRGLKKWEGWRVDIADLRAGMGGVFDV